MLLEHPLVGHLLVPWAKRRLLWPKSSLLVEGKKCYPISLRDAEFSESLSCTKQGFSVEDHWALAILESPARKVDGHYQLTLPWRSLVYQTIVLLPHADYMPSRDVS